jgi:RimJ/RimL family protein N-acetyltransferase
MGACIMMSNQSGREMKAEPIFQGELVYLIPPDPETDAGLFARWMRDSEFVRLMDADPAKLMSIEKHKQWLEKDLLEEQRNDELFFMIRTRKEKKTIGLIGLDGIRWVHGEAWIGIGLGEREHWGKGYGTDAMLVIQRYAFDELNLHRLSLTVFEYNQRAIRSYEKAGFIVEGRARKFLNREGRRYDMIFMGILRDEWERMVGRKR